MAVYSKVVKRGLDILLSFLGLVVLSPVFGCIALAVKMGSKGPVFFRQERVGAHGRTFEIIKFRTMRVDSPHNTPTDKLKRPDRWITRTGHFLRRTSLDELPQLWNILRGDMSVVGPRPALPKQKNLLKARQQYGANDIRPGLTGWAQINGRDTLPDEQKAKLDGDYVRRMSFGFDCICFFKTIGCVIREKGFAEGKIQKERDEAS